MQHSRTILGLALLVAGLGVSTPAGADERMDRLQFLVGEWTQSGVMRPESFGEAGGDYSGPTSCVWGPWQAWLECDFHADPLAGLGPYAVHVVIHPAGEAGSYRAFVVNNHGSSIYDGAFAEDGELVFTAAGRNARQRVGYRLLDDGRVRFVVHESRPGDTVLLPHTDAHWTRQP